MSATAKTQSSRGKRSRDLEQGDAPAGPNAQPLLHPALAPLLEQVIKSCLPQGKNFDELLLEISKGDLNYNNLLDRFMEPATSTAYPSLKEGDKVPLCVNVIVGRIETGYYLTQDKCPSLHTDAFKKVSPKVKKEMVMLAVGKGALTDLMDLKIGYAALGESCDHHSYLRNACNALVKQLVAPFLPGDVYKRASVEDVFFDYLDVETVATSAAVAIPDDVLKLLQEVVNESKVEEKWSTLITDPGHSGLWKRLQTNESDGLGSESATSLNTVLANIKSNPSHPYLVPILPYLAGRTPAQKKELIQAALAFGACQEMQWLRNGVDASTTRHTKVNTICGALVRQALAPLLRADPATGRKPTDLRDAILQLHRYFFLLDFRPALIDQTAAPVLVAGAGAPVAADANLPTNHVPVAGGGIHLPTASGPMPTQPPTSGDFAVLEACNSGLMTRICTLQAEKEVAQAEASQHRAALKAQKEEADATNKHLESKVAEMAAAQEKQAEENRHLQEQQAKDLKAANELKAKIAELEKEAKKDATAQQTKDGTIKALNAELQKAKAKNAKWKETFAGLANMVQGGL